MRYNRSNREFRYVQNESKGSGESSRSSIASESLIQDLDCKVAYYESLMDEYSKLGSPKNIRRALESAKEFFNGYHQLLEENKQLESELTELEGKLSKYESVGPKEEVKTTADQVLESADKLKAVLNPKDDAPEEVEVDDIPTGVDENPVEVKVPEKSVTKVIEPIPEEDENDDEDESEDEDEVNPITESYNNVSNDLVRLRRAIKTL